MTQYNDRRCHDIRKWHYDAIVMAGYYNLTTWSQQSHHQIVSRHSFHHAWQHVMVSWSIIMSGIRSGHLKRDFLKKFQHCWICRPTDSTVSTVRVQYASIEPRNLAAFVLAARSSNHPLQQISSKCRLLLLWTDCNVLNEYLEISHSATAVFLNQFQLRAFLPHTQLMYQQCSLRAEPSLTSYFFIPNNAGLTLVGHKKFFLLQCYMMWILQRLHHKTMFN